MKKGKSVFSLIWPIALIIIALYLFLLFKGGKAFDFGRVEYKETTATCESVGHEITRSQIDRSMEGRPNDKDQYYIIYNYSYEVDGITYHASDRNHREFQDYQSCQRDIEESQEWIGTTKTVYYNPEDPSEYSFSSKNFKESVSETNWVVGVIVVLCSVILLPWIIFMGVIRSVLRKRADRFRK